MRHILLILHSLQKIFNGFLNFICADVAKSKDFDVARPKYPMMLSQKQNKEKKKTILKDDFKFSVFLCAACTPDNKHEACTEIF